MTPAEQALFTAALTGEGDQRELRKTVLREQLDQKGEPVIHALIEQTIVCRREMAKRGQLLEQLQAIAGETPGYHPGRSLDYLDQRWRLALDEYPGLESLAEHTRTIASLKENLRSTQTALEMQRESTEPLFEELGTRDPVEAVGMVRGLLRLGQMLGASK